jgi:hypothetical protein
MLGGYRSYLERRMSWVQGAPTVFIFDDAQVSYVDTELWGDFFKSMSDYPERRAIAFTSYGSPTTRSGLPSTPVEFNDTQRVTLRAVDHNDGIQPVGLLFSRPEFDDLVSRFYPRPEFLFDDTFFQNVFAMTDGHVGAIRSFVDIVLAHEVGLFYIARDCYLTSLSVLSCSPNHQRILHMESVFDMLWSA